MRITVHVKPKSSKNKVEAHSLNEFTIWVTAPPVDNQANEAVCALLAKHLGVAKSRVMLFRGAGSREKIFEVT